MSVLSAAIAAQAILPSNAWAMEDASGTTALAALYGAVTLAKNGSPGVGVFGTVVPDGVNKVCTFSGTGGDVFTASVTFPGTGDFWTRAYIRTTTTGGPILLLSNNTAGNGFWLGLNNNNVAGHVTLAESTNFVTAAPGDAAINVAGGGSSDTGPTMPNVTDGASHCVEGGRRGAFIEVWVDGQLYKKSAALNYNLTSSSQTLGIGAFPSGGSFPFTGKMVYGCWFLAAPTPAQVLAVYNASLDTTAQELFAATPANIAKNTYGQIVVTTRTSGPAWSAATNSPKFLVSGASVSLVSSTVTDANTAELVIDTTGSGLVSYTVTTDAANGGQGTTCTTNTLANSNDPYTASTIIVGGKNATLLTPLNGPQNGRSKNACVWTHGAGETYLSVTSGNKTPVIRALCGRGWHVLASDAEGANDWGNGAGGTDYLAGYTYLVANVSGLSGVFWGAQSMGGLAAANLFSGAHGSVPLSKALVGFAPCANQDDLGAPQAGYTSWLTNIETSFGIGSSAPRDATWITNVDPYNPTRVTASNWSGKKARIWASASDTDVNKTYNADALGTAINGGGGTATVVAKSGPHLDASQFPADEVLSFLAPILDPPAVVAGRLPPIIHHHHRQQAA